MSQTWVIKDTAPVDEASYILNRTDIAFTSGGGKFSSIEVDTDDVVVFLFYRRDNHTTEQPAAMDLSMGETQFYWTADNEKYKKLEFDTAPTGELLLWLQKNATLKIPGIKYQDIHLEDKALWNQFQTEWNSGNYAAAIELLKNAALTNKQLNAAVINDITTVITKLENQKDDSFKTDKIKVASEPPADLTDGGVYFQLIRQTDDYGEVAQLIGMMQKNGNNYVELYPITYASNVDVPKSISASSSLDDIMAVLSSYFISG